MRILGFSTLVAVGFLGLSGVAQATAVTCDMSEGNRYVTVDPAMEGGYCYTQEGNLQNADISAIGLAIVDKDTTSDFPTGDPSEGALQFTRTTDTSGSFSFADALWDIWSSLYVAFHFGNGSGSPDSFVVQLDPRDTSGTYMLTGPQNGLSNIYLLGIRCTDQGGCNPPTDVPEPGTLALLGLGLVGLGFGARRKKA